VPVPHLGSDLQEEVGTSLAPSHLLFFDEPFAQHLVDGRFHKCRGNGFSLPVALSIIRKKGAVEHDVSLEGANRFEQFPVLGLPILTSSA
jgi:hypothetical protein